MVLSHGHYDHSGGLPHVVSKKPSIELYCHPAVVVPRYSIPAGGQVKAIYIPQDAKTALNNALSDRLHWVTKPMHIAPGIGITGPIPRKNDFENTGGPFFLDPEGQRADPIADDQALWIETAQGLAIVDGCSHAGLVNTIKAIRDFTDESAVAAVIGGFILRTLLHTDLKRH